MREKFASGSFVNFWILKLSYENGAEAEALKGEGF